MLTIIPCTDWIAYGLMDSIVDTFFPLIDFIEAEADDIDEFLANPLQVDESATPVASANTQEGSAFRNVIRQQWRRFRPAWLQVRTPQVTQFFGLIKTTAIITQREANFSRMGEKKHRPHHSNAGPKTLSHKALLGVNSDLYDRGKMLTRIAVARKLVMGLSRLLVPKNDVVRGLRKRLRDERSHLIATEPGQRHDIGIYLGDLQGESFTSFGEGVLSLTYTRAG
jgi:Mg2+ and Co2+ transporter CorA